MNTPVLIIGGGGHTKVLIDVIRLRLIPMLGILDAETAKTGTEISGVRVIGDDNAISDFDPERILLVNGVGSIRRPHARIAVSEKFRAMGFRFATIIHPSSIIASEVTIGEGAQIMAGAVVQPGVTIGANTIVNTHASIDHDCQIGENVHLAPNVTLSGGVVVGNDVHIGTGAVIIQGIIIGKNSVIGAGSVVIDNVPNDTEVVGSPARTLRKTSVAEGA